MPPRLPADYSRFLGVKLIERDRITDVLLLRHNPTSSKMSLLCFYHIPRVMCCSTLDALSITAVQLPSPHHRQAVDNAMDAQVLR